MGRPSTVRRLPGRVKEALDAWLRDPGVTQVEATERVNAMLAEFAPGHAPVSRQSVNRYDLSMREVGKRIQESREIAEVWVAKLGSQPSGKVGHLITEALRTLALEVTKKVMEGELTADSLPGVMSHLKDLALAEQRLSRSASENERRERLIRAEERQLAAEEAAEAAERSGARQGLSAETVGAIKREVLGIAA